METLKDEEELASFLYNNPEVIVKYHTDKECPDCDRVLPIFKKLAENPQYSNIKFAMMNSDNNPVAQRLINKRKLPFAATYKNSLLIESQTVLSEDDLKKLLESLPKVKLNL